MAALKSFVVCFLMLPLSVACANQTSYHTMLYVKILNYSNTGTLQLSGGNMPVSTSGSGGNMPVSTSGSDSCCYMMPLQNCTNFCKTVFSICIESKCDTYLFNITYNYDTGRIYDENYGVERLNVQSIKDQTINIDVTEIKTNIRTGSSIVSKIDSFAAKYSRPPSGSFWLSRMYPLRLQNNVSSIDLQITAFCESNWYDPRQNCAENIQSNNLQSVHYNFGNRTFAAELDCATEETSKITFITKRPYKFTKQILEAQLSRFIADRVCSSIAVDVTIYIHSVRYDSNLLRVVFTSHCNMHNSSLLSIANKYIEVSDLKLNQALMFLSSYEERQYFIDPVLRDDFSSAQNLGNFQLFFRLKRFENPNNIYFTNDFRGLRKLNCPERGCTPSFHFTYQGVEHTLRKHSPAEEPLIDCFGNLVDELNPMDKMNNSLFWHISKPWDTHDSIKLEIYQNDNNKEPIAIMDIELDNVDVVSSSYLLARPTLINKTINFINVSVEIEMMAWCSTGFYGKACNETCPPDNIKCNIGECIDLHTIHQDASSLQLNYHCRKGKCYHGVCHCPDGFAGERCNVVSNYILPYNKTYHFLDDITSNTTCEDGYKNFNCDERDFCYNNLCKHGRCSNDVNIYSCVCDDGFEGLNCDRDIDYCKTAPCQNNATCLDEQTNYTCICGPGYTGLNCEEDINYCTNNTCLNHAICIEEQTNYTCICHPEYTGLNCEADINYCTTNTCQSNATCLEEQTNYTCICQPGYTGLNCEIDINYCTNNTCQNNATCLEEQTNYTCICQPGYAGRNCEVDINYCTNNTCQNNATCIEEQTNYTCLCQPGYAGRNCEIDINYCTNNTCLNNATCIEEQTNYTCICQSGYTELNCEEDINYCTNKTCLNNVTCIEEQTHYTCICQPGYTGLNCEEDINYCTNKTCLNNATCIEEQTNYTCICQPGYTGHNCEENINYCTNKTCLNNANCIEEQTNYTCICQPGYTGRNCEIDINYCTYYTCQNNATCFEEQTNYTCICQPGYSGLNCEKDVNYCTNNTCQNNATCIEEQTNYTCICQPGYSGLNCEKDINYCTYYTCQNNATCIEEQTNYTCICQPGYSGLNCEEDINYCTNNTCQNNATCIEEQTHYTCFCQPGYAGLNCEIDINYCTNNTCLNNATCIDEQTNFKCFCQPGFTGMNCENYTDICSEESCKNNGTCEVIDGSFICQCPFGFEGKHCESVSNSSLQTRDAIDAGCSGSGWNITVNITLLKQLDPVIVLNNIHFGDNACGGKEVGNLLLFQQGFQECLTNKQISGNMLLYINDLFYVIYDPINPYIIRRHEWTFTVQCDVDRNEAASSHVHHDANAQHIEVSGQYRIDLAFYKDVNFMHELPGNPLHINLGDDIYVKVYTTVNDWTTKMRLHTCYTKPNDAAGMNMTYFIIRNGCEVDSNTHIISQSTHETKFVFQDFEYSTNREGLDIHCNATFCDTKDYSPGCAQSCILP